jgi:Flp pilus assembly protein TadG
MVELGTRLVHDERGSVLIESALALPVLFLLAFGIIETGRGLWIQNTLQFSVEAAARCAAINSTTCGSNAGVQAAAVAAATGIGTVAGDYTVETLTCGKRVSVAFTFDGKIPGMSSFAPVLRASACYPT